MRKMFLICACLPAIFLASAKTLTAGNAVPPPDSAALDGGALNRATILGTTSWGAAQGQRLDKEALRTAGNLSEALRSFPGVQIKDYGGIGGLKTVNVRSLGSEHIGVFIDGVAVENAQNMQVDLGRFPLDGFASLELYNGQRSERLQSAKEYAGASAIYLTSEAPDFRPGEKSRTTVGVKGGSFGTFSPTLRHVRKLGKSLKLDAQASLLSSHGRYRFHATDRYLMPDGTFSGYDTTLTRLNADLRSATAQARLWGHRGGSVWDVHAYFYDSERGLPGPVVRRTSLNPSSKDRQEDRNIFLQGNFRHGYQGLWNCYSTLLLRGKLSRDHTRYRTDPAQDPGAMPIDNSYDQAALYLSAAHMLLPGDGWSVNLAADAQYNTLSSNVRDFVFPRRLSFWEAAALAFWRPAFRVSASILFFQAADRFNSPQGGFSKENRFRYAVSPSLIWTWDILPDNRLEASGFAKRSYRMPSFNDLYYTLVGNSALEPEDAWQYDLALTATGALAGKWNLILRLDAYRNEVSNKIIAVPTVNQFRWTMYNIGKARIHGAEAMASLQWGAPNGDKKAAGFALDGKYTFQQALDLSRKDSPTYRGQIPYIPLHSATFSLRAAWNDWRLSCSTLCSGSRWSSSANLEEYRLDPYLTADLWLARTLSIALPRTARPTSLTLRLALNNLTGSRYEVVQGYPMPGRHCMVSLEYTF